MIKKLKEAVTFYDKGCWQSDLSASGFLKRAGVQFVRFVSTTIKSFIQHRCGLHAAGLTYFSILGFVPVICMLMVCAKACGLGNLAREKINDQIDAFISQVETGQKDAAAAAATAPRAEDAAAQAVVDEKVKVANYKAEARDRADFLDDRDLLGAGGFEHHVELRLLLGGSGGGGRAGHGDGGGGGNAPRLLERLHEFVDFENRLARQFLDEFFIRHCLFPFLLVNQRRVSCAGNHLGGRAGARPSRYAAGASPPSFLAFSESTRARRVAGSLRSMSNVARSWSLPGTLESASTIAASTILPS